MITIIKKHTVPVAEAVCHGLEIFICFHDLVPKVFRYYNTAAAIVEIQIIVSLHRNPVDARIVSIANILTEFGHVSDVALRNHNDDMLVRILGFLIIAALYEIVLYYSYLFWIQASTVGCVIMVGRSSSIVDSITLSIQKIDSRVAKKSSTELGSKSRLARAVRDHNWCYSNTDTHQKIGHITSIHLLVIDVNTVIDELPVRIVRTKSLSILTSAVINSVARKFWPTGCLS